MTIPSQNDAGEAKATPAQGDSKAANPFEQLSSDLQSVLIQMQAGKVSS